MMGANPRDARQMQMMMKRLGMTTEDVPDVEEVVVRTRTQEHVFRKPDVTILIVQGVRTYQVVGSPQIRPRGASSAASAASGPAAAPPAPSGPPEEDIQLVMSQANVSREEAIEALFQSHGAPAEAILLILSRDRSG